MTDIIDLIDDATAPVCGWCQHPLPDDSVSAYYCDDECQYEWERLRGEALVGYREPEDLAAYYIHAPRFVDDEPLTRITTVPSPGLVIWNEEAVRMHTMWRDYITDQLTDHLLLYGFDYGTRVSDASMQAFSGLRFMWTPEPVCPFPGFRSVWESATAQAETAEPAERMPDLPAVLAENLFAYTDDGDTAVLQPQMPELPPPTVRFGQALNTNPGPRQRAPRTIQPRGCT